VSESLVDLLLAVLAAYGAGADAGGETFCVELCARASGLESTLADRLTVTLLESIPSRDTVAMVRSECNTRRKEGDLPSDLVSSPSDEVIYWPVTTSVRRRLESCMLLGASQSGSEG